MRFPVNILWLGALAWVAVPVCAAFSVVNTSVEYEPAPLALDLDWNPSPRFAWALDGAGAVQSSFRITVVSVSTRLTVWDSGVVSSSASSQIPFASTNATALLETDADYSWTVCACVAADCNCSAESLFSCAPSAAAWAADAVFIGGFPAMRANFTLTSTPITRARLYATGVGVFESWVNGVRAGAPNGVRAGASVLAPGWSTVAPVRVLAHAYDVAPLLVAGGENVLGVRTGMGKYGYMGVYCTGGEAACNAAALLLVVTQCAAPGVCFNTTFASDGAHWLGSDSPITFVS